MLPNTIKDLLELIRINKTPSRISLAYPRSGFDLYGYRGEKYWYEIIYLRDEFFVLKNNVGSIEIVSISKIATVDFESPTLLDNLSKRK